MYFVIYKGDTEKDPLDRGVEYFYTMSDAFIFIGTVANKGYEYELYEGKRIE